jgi:radical SAM family uncharacterized protein
MRATLPEKLQALSYPATQRAQRTAYIMPRKADQSSRHRVRAEIGAIRKSWNSRIRIALAYPNRYHVGMSNLGYLTVYGLLNRYEHVVCERVFLPDETAKGPALLTTLESGQAVAAVDIIAFSLSFENDYPSVLAMLEAAGIPLRTGERNHRHPLVIAGGVACLLNPEPLAEFIDCFFIGEAEEMLPPFIQSFDPQQDRKTALFNLARNVPGVYVPAYYQVRYHDDGTLAEVEPLADVPRKIKRVYCKDLDLSATCSSIITPDTTFSNTLLVETGRGCPHGCRFCSAGFIYRPPRFRSIPHLEQTIKEGTQITDRIGLVGAAVSDLPGIEELCRKFRDQDIRLSFSSLRADRLTNGLLAALQQSKVKTATIAPEVGSQRMRQVVNKGITEADVLRAAAVLVENGIANLKLYFMVGLPTETEADVDAIAALVKKIKHRFLASSRTRKRIGTITVSLNSFVPKPFTPFQWAAMDSVDVLKKKIKKIKGELKKVANLRFNSDIPRWAYIQALLSRGDRRVADILALSHANGGNWPQTFKMTAVNPDFYVLRERSPDEMLPWDIIDPGVKKSFLLREWQRAVKGLNTPDCQVDSCRMCGIC